MTSRKAAGETGNEGAAQHPEPRASIGSSAALEKPIERYICEPYHDGEGICKQHTKDRAGNWIKYESYVVAVKKHKSTRYELEEGMCGICNKYTNILFHNKGKALICRDCAIEQDFGKVE